MTIHVFARHQQRNVGNLRAAPNIEWNESNAHEHRRAKASQPGQTHTDHAPGKNAEDTSTQHEDENNV